MSRFSLSTFQRLPIYLNYLNSIDLSKQSNISATQIANALGLGEIQVRKDLASLSCMGRPKTGYEIKVLIQSLKSTLGCNTKTDAVIVGVGKLGQALMGYSGFAEFGLNIVAGFDIDKNKIGMTIMDKNVYPIDALFDFVCRNNVKLVILTLPQAMAQPTVDLLKKSTVKGIWNFSTAHVIAPEGVTVKSENMAASLALLSKQINED